MKIHVSSAIKGICNTHPLHKYTIYFLANFIRNSSLMVLKIFNNIFGNLTYFNFCKHCIRSALIYSQLFLKMQKYFYYSTRSIGIKEKHV